MQARFAVVGVVLSFVIASLAGACSGARVEPPSAQLAYFPATVESCCGRNPKQQAVHDRDSALERRLNALQFTEQSRASIRDCIDSVVGANADIAALQLRIADVEGSVNACLDHRLALDPVMRSQIVSLVREHPIEWDDVQQTMYQSWGSCGRKMYDCGGECPVRTGAGFRCRQELVATAPPESPAPLTSPTSPLASPLTEPSPISPASLAPAPPPPGPPQPTAPAPPAPETAKTVLVEPMIDMRPQMTRTITFSALSDRIQPASYSALDEVVVRCGQVGTCLIRIVAPASSELWGARTRTTAKYLSATGRVDADRIEMLFGAKGDSPNTATVILAESGGAVLRQPVVRAELSKVDILPVVRDSLTKVRACGQKHNETTGAIKMVWKIDRGGKPQDVAVADPRLAGTAVAACVTAVVQGMRFPAYTGTPPPPVSIPLPLHE